MGYGFKIGGRGIILRPTVINVYDGDTELSSLTIEGSAPVKALRFTYIADNGKIGDGTVKLTSNSDLLSVSQTNAQKANNEFTLTFNGMDVDEQNVSLVLEVEETKHFLATSTLLPITLKRSEPTIVLATTNLDIVGGSPNGSINITSYDGDGELTATSSDTDFATVAVENLGVAVTYINGDKTLTVTVGCKAGKFYKASKGVECTVTCTKSTPTLMLTSTMATVYGGGSSALISVTYSGLNASTDNIGELNVLSDNAKVATGSIQNSSLTIAYVSAGNTVIRVVSAETNYYYSTSVSVTVTCLRTEVALPSLTNTSVSFVGNPVSPGLNYDTATVNVWGDSTTTSINSSLTVWFGLKDSNRYCWKDGTLSNRSIAWGTYGGTMAIYTSANGALPWTRWVGTCADWSSFKPSNDSGSAVNVKNAIVWQNEVPDSNPYKGNAPIVGVTYTFIGDSDMNYRRHIWGHVDTIGTYPVDGTTYSISNLYDVSSY